MKVKVSLVAVPSGTYKAKYLGGKMIKTPRGPNDEAYLMSFEILGGDSNGMETTRLVNHSGKSPKAHIVQLFSDLAGVDPSNGMGLDDSDYVDARYEITVVNQGDDGYTKMDKIIRRLGDDEKPDPVGTDEAPF